MIDLKTKKKFLGVYYAIAGFDNAGVHCKAREAFQGF